MHAGKSRSGLNSFQQLFLEVGIPPPIEVLFDVPRQCSFGAFASTILQLYLGLRLCALQLLHDRLIMLQVVEQTTVASSLEEVAVVQRVVLAHPTMSGLLLAEGSHMQTKYN